MFHCLHSSMHRFISGDILTFLANIVYTLLHHRLGLAGARRIRKPRNYRAILCIVLARAEYFCARYVKMARRTNRSLPRESTDARDDNDVTQQDDDDG